MDFRAMPKVVLHDHLDGGVRPATAAALADERGVELPVAPSELADWFTLTPAMDFTEAWKRFGLITEILQDAAALERVAREAVLDLAEDGVVYAEIRFAPLLHTASGLDGDAVLAAVVAGLEAGEAEAAGAIQTRLLVCGLREEPPARATQAAALAVSWAAGRVVGFDLAGAEQGHPATDYAEAVDIARAGGLGITIHAGEMDGVASVASALDVGAARLGHGMRLIEDCEVRDGAIVSMGDTAAAVLAARLALEVCVTSNACLGTPVAEHPVRLLHDAGFDVAPNPDDRAITTTTPSRELALWAQFHGFTDDELAAAQRRALAAAFCDDATRTASSDRLGRR